MVPYSASDYRHKEEIKQMRERENAIKTKTDTELKASLTVEAAFVVPICFYAILVFLYLFIYVHTQFLVYQAMYYVSDEIYPFGTTVAYAETSGLFNDVFSLAGEDLTIDATDFLDELDDYIVGGYGKDYVQSEIQDYFDSHDVELSCVEDEEKGLDCSQSTVYEGNGDIYIVVKYTFKFPVPFFEVGNKEICQQLHIKGFYGEDWSSTNEFDGEINKSSDDETETDKEYVYVAKNGTVYHVSANCTYLSRNITKTNIDKVVDLRNSSGGRYYACEYCCKKDDITTVYITEYGDRYHSSKSCSRLERDVSKITKDAAIQRGLRACSKCGN
jgi:hypothetical protein